MGPTILYTLTFRLLPEFIIRKIKTSLLHPVLGTVSSRCAKKTVVRMTELVAALPTVHGSLSFLANVDCLLDPSGESVWFPVNHRCVSPIVHVVFLHSFQQFSCACSLLECYASFTHFVKCDDITIGN